MATQVMEVSLLLFLNSMKLTDDVTTVVQNNNINGGSTNNVNDNNNDDDDRSDRKLFLGGLSWDTSEEDVKEYFGNVLGLPVESVSVKYDALTQTPRGFGFITFCDASSVETVLSSKSGPHKIKDKIIDPKRAKSRPIVKKIFVGGVESTLPEESIRAYFESRFGSVEGIELPFDKVRGKRREFVFVIFDDEEAANAAASQPKQRLGGREVDVKKATPQPIAQAMKMRDNNTYYYNHDEYASSGHGHHSYSSRGGGYSGPRKGSSSSSSGLGGYGHHHGHPPRTSSAYYSTSSHSNQHHHPDYYGYPYSDETGGGGYGYPGETSYPYPSSGHHYPPPGVASPYPPYNPSYAAGEYHGHAPPPSSSSGYDAPGYDDYYGSYAPSSSSSGGKIRMPPPTTTGRHHHHHHHPYAAPPPSSRPVAGHHYHHLHHH